MFKFIVADAMATNAQWENPPGWQLTKACASLSSPGGVVSNWGAFFAAQAGGCTSFTVDGFLGSALSTSLSDQTGNRAWLFQQCTEFGWFDGVDYGSSIFFGDTPLELELNFCQRAFGIPMRPRTSETNAIYGGLDPQATNIFYTNGLFDPWHTISLLNTTSNNLFVANYAAGHCAPMTAPTSADPLSLQDARNRVRKFLSAFARPAQLS